MQLDRAVHCYSHNRSHRNTGVDRQAFNDKKDKKALSDDRKNLTPQCPLMESFDLDDFTRIAVTLDWSVHMPLKDGCLHMTIKSPNK